MKYKETQCEVKNYLLVKLYILKLQIKIHLKLHTNILNKKIIINIDKLKRIKIETSNPIFRNTNFL